MTALELLGWQGKVRRGVMLSLDASASHQNTTSTIHCAQLR